MEQDILEKLATQEAKIDAIYVSMEKLRKYFFWTFWITIVTIVLPLIALIFVLPWFIGTMSSAYNLNI